ncbi:hypothetical protein HYDPIDRAFT_29683 [Hydnomerulius pinastri MD-312]|uniref:Uncharacterized protein n=1 Tax=Hydnomerulius pinastri MD-312 TaxID=994086 RepID=A0A0C9WCE9_9AGAM|nr:hypothetical protein HYDPIDRAFT_31192 [Hydnomerulius pinastri MD-312]KIJ63443.1 hypothetical protein HYDPIDRAFT_29683 [Hydnomerulius pinastri MD-312]
MPITLDNQLSFELPLKYPDTYRVTSTPEAPGPAVTIEITASNYPTFSFKVEENNPNDMPMQTETYDKGKGMAVLAEMPGTAMKRLGSPQQATTSSRHWHARVQ